MKKHAYLIMVHKNIEQVQRLVNALDSEYNDIYIHIDKKYHCDKQKITTSFSKLYIFSNIDVKWGDYSIVECELLLLKKAINGNYSYYHLLSGEDFPIKKKSEIYNFFEKNKKEFIFFTNSNINSKDMDRVLYKHVMLGKLRSSQKKIINKLYFEIDNLFIRLYKIARKKKKLYFEKY